jgi:hypothetical protein
VGHSQEIAMSIIWLVTRDSAVDLSFPAVRDQNVSTLRLLMVAQAAVSKIKPKSKSLIVLIPPANSSLEVHLVDGVTKSKSLAKRLLRLLLIHMR